MSVAVKKLEGVETADVSLQNSSAVITLKPNNTITLAQLRSAIRKSGYPTRDAEITARGRLTGAGDTFALDLLNGSTLRVVTAPTPATDKILEVVGISRTASKNVEQLTIASVK